MHINLIELNDHRRFRRGQLKKRLKQPSYNTSRGPSWKAIGILTIVTAAILLAASLVSKAHPNANDCKGPYTCPVGVAMEGGQ